MLVFSVPWEQAFVAFNISSLSRLIGVAAIGMGLFTVAASGHVRRPGVIVWVSVAFTCLCLLSLLWSISPASTAGRAFTHLQLLAMVWLVRELARSLDQQQSLMLAYVLGVYISVADLLRRFIVGEQIGGRYTGSNLDANDLGLTLALGIPMAWYLYLNRTRSVRYLGAIYIPLAVLAILLTASRGAFLSMIVALSIIPFTVRWRSFRSMVLCAVLLAAIGLAASVVPQSTWDRLSTIGGQIAGGGTMSKRTVIWGAGVEVFRNSPLLGIGAGAYDDAVQPLIGLRIVAHNVYLAVLTEQGIIGFTVFIALLASCGVVIYRLPQQERKVWAVIGLTWSLGVMSLSWEYRKTTWLLIGLVAAQAVVVSAREHVSKSRRSRIGSARIEPVYSPSVVQRASH
jgi:O-antigen ligase